MLEAAVSKRFNALFYRYNEFYLLRRHFRYIGISGELLPAEAADRPVLYLMNHSSWWDGLLAYHAAGKSPSRCHYFMMEEEQLRKYAFFRKLGAYSINRHNRADIGVSLRYTVRLLREGGNVWMYPEGEILPLEHRPLILKEGAALVLRLCPEAVVLPVTLYHGLFFHSKPEATLLAGAPLIRSWRDMDRRSINGLLQTVLQKQLDDHRQILLNHKGHMPGHFRPLMATGRSTNEWFDAWRGRGRNR